MFYLLSPRREGFTRGTEQSVCQMLGYVSIIANFIEILYKTYLICVMLIILPWSFTDEWTNHQTILQEWSSQQHRNEKKIQYHQGIKWQQFTDHNCVFEFEKKCIPLMYKIVLKNFHLYNSRIECRPTYVHHYILTNKESRHLSNNQNHNT